jgi:hypothetical protein
MSWSRFPHPKQDFGPDARFQQVWFLIRIDPGGITSKLRAEIRSARVPHLAQRSAIQP